MLGVCKSSPPKMQGGKEVAQLMQASYGTEDELGTLNRLTDDIVKAAAAEIKTGTRISLNLPLDALGEQPFFGRQAFHRELVAKTPRTGKSSLRRRKGLQVRLRLSAVNDDIWTFNTQSSSQWDGLRHYGYQKEKLFYNGVTLDEIHERAEDKARKPDVLGIHAWSERGIVGRGVLLDWHAWRVAQGKAHAAFETQAISLAELRAVAVAQGTRIKFGDILIVRTGFLDAYRRLSRAESDALRARPAPAFAGVEQSGEMAEFLWSNVSACAGDQPSWEAWPSRADWALHELMLAGWGMPIGELFDLEELAAHCERAGRWEFFLTSEPVNVPGGVASPPNILAIF